MTDEDAKALANLAVDAVMHLFNTGNLQTLPSVMLAALIEILKQETDRREKTE